jgi:hypothetical protein
MFFIYTHNFLIRICVAFALGAIASITVVTQQPSRTQEQKPSGGSVIRGRVTYADTGHPLRRAEVTLLSPDRDIDDTKSVTDRNGEFAFYNVSAGKYLLLTQAPDIVNHGLDSSRDLLSLKIALGQIGDGFSEVTVDGRSSVKTEIRVIRGGVITGRVLTETDEPIAKALIKLFRVEENGRARPTNLTSHMNSDDQWMFETDSRGIYRIAGLPSGEYIVQASESAQGGNADEVEEGSYADGSMMIAFHLKALKVQDATSVNVVQGSESRDVDIRFTDRVPHRISGLVTLKGQPAAFVEIFLSRDDSGQEGFRFGSGQTRSGPDGRWEIRAVPDGNYTLGVSGYATVTTDGQQEYKLIAPLPRKLVVEGDDLTNLKIELVSGASVSGLVAFEGEATTPTNVFVELISAVPATEAGESSDSEVNIAGRSFLESAGKFTVAGLHSGSYYFHLINLGNNHYVKSITLNGKDALRDPVKVEEGKSLNGIRIVLSSELVSLTGRVVEKDDRSKPLRDAVVLLFPVEVERRRVTETPIAVRTDKEGRFVVKSAPGDYFVVVFDRGRKDMPVTLPSERSIVKNSSTMQKITLQPGDEKKVVEVTGPSQP